MPSYRYRVVDVFTERPLEGNPLAVFESASGLGTFTMQKIARELNLAETVFVFPPTHPKALAKLRIFTPQRELLFAGHPTIGTAFVLRKTGAIPESDREFVLEEGVGNVAVRVDEDGGRLWLTAPPIDFGPTLDRISCAKALSLSEEDLLPASPQIVDPGGNPTVIVGVNDKTVVDRVWVEGRTVDQIKGDYTKLACAFVFCLTSEGVYSRMFAPQYGIPEDPATGSSTCALAGYLMKHSLLDKTGWSFVCEQGTKMGRRSLLHVRIQQTPKGELIEVGGDVTPLVDATMHLGELPPGEAR